MRDWFPLSAMNPFSDVVDLLLGQNAEFGALKCGCHPNCGIGTVLLVNKRTKQMVPVSEFLDVEQILRDMQQIADAGHGRGRRRLAKIGLSLLRNFRADARSGRLRHSRSSSGSSPARSARAAAKSARAKATPASSSGASCSSPGCGSRISSTTTSAAPRCASFPYGTQLGEISFCAYNTGVGWRQIIEKMKQTATVAEWFKTRGRHPVYAKNQDLPLPEGPLSLVAARDRPAAPAPGSRLTGLNRGSASPRTGVSAFVRRPAVELLCSLRARARLFCSAPSTRSVGNSSPPGAAAGAVDRRAAAAADAERDGGRASAASPSVQTEPELPGAPEFEAQRAAILGRARGEPLLWVRQPESRFRRPIVEPGAKPMAGDPRAAPALRRSSGELQKPPAARGLRVFERPRDRARAGHSARATEAVR